MAFFSKSDKSPHNQFKCTVCLDEFVRPKLLPCSHTFCEPCLAKVVGNSLTGRSFACPYCRERITVPPGGASAFKNNIYLNQEIASEKKKSQKPPCTVHPERDIELFCLQCEACICLKCKLDRHLHHNTQDVALAVQNITFKLSSDKPELDKAISDLKNHMEAFRSEQQSVAKKKRAVEEDIMKRYEMMIAMAKKCRDDALFSLDTVIASINSQMLDTVDKMENTVDELTKLNKRIERCLKGETDSRVLVDVQDIYQNASKLKTILKKLMATRILSIARPLLRFSSTASATLDAERKFLGPVVRIDIPFQAQSTNIKKLFQSRADRRSYEVFSLFPRTDDTVWLAYESYPVKEEKPEKRPDLFSITGTIIRSKPSVTGRISFTHADNGTEVHTVQSAKYFGTFAKSRNPFELRNDLQGAACLMGIAADKENPLKTYAQPLYMFRCGLHRAFDADKNKLLCAVVEEAQPPEHQRKVKIYQQPAEFPVATYSSPIQPFQPSDVCFYQLAGRQVLLVSDELNDAVHVVHVQNSRMEFGGYLAPGCALITQPTALNTDGKGRLWLACRAGDVLLYQPPEVRVEDLYDPLNRLAAL